MKNSREHVREARASESLIRLGLAAAALGLVLGALL